MLCLARGWQALNTPPIAASQLMAKERVPVDPYIIHTTTGKLHSISKLFADPSNAFVRGALPQIGTDQYRWLTCIDHIPVPSRLYQPLPNNLPPDHPLPLNGIRFGIKDSIDVAGLETGCGSSYYRSFYQPKTTSAAFISQLISAGAVIVGKMRCSQWCDGQDPLQRFEEITPTNPRGDTFQKPSASSSGSAAGTASYEWLDFTIGTDMGGSTRHPAGVNGLYGMRPSWGSVSNSGLTCSELMDTPGILARSAAVTRAVAAVMARPAITTTEKTAKSARNIQYKFLYAVEPGPSDAQATPKFFYPGGKAPEAKAETGEVFEQFIKKLEEHLHCRRHEVCIFDLWREAADNGTRESRRSDGNDLPKHRLPRTMAPGKYPSLVDESSYFIHDEYSVSYRKHHFINGAPILTQTFLFISLKKPSLKNEYLLINNKSSSSANNCLFADGIRPFIDDRSPFSIEGTPRYRDDVIGRTNGGLFWKGVSPYSISYCSGCPDITVPFGEAKFH
ncbi:amidase signature domain-containing protein [Hypoxylon sp. FL1284]|nr:amidase signature domain-containing protein [Hypoxylon sp. FL1284]